MVEATKAQTLFSSLPSDVSFQLFLFLQPVGRRDIRKNIGDWILFFSFFFPPLPSFPQRLGVIFFWTSFFLFPRLRRRKNFELMDGARKRGDGIVFPFLPPPPPLFFFFFLVFTVGGGGGFFFFLGWQAIFFFFPPPSLLLSGRKALFLPVLFPFLFVPQIRLPEPGGKRKMGMMHDGFLPPPSPFFPYFSKPCFLKVSLPPPPFLVQSVADKILSEGGLIPFSVPSFINLEGSVYIRAFFFLPLPPSLSSSFSFHDFSPTSFYFEASHRTGKLWKTT